MAPLNRTLSSLKPIIIHHFTHPQHPVQLLNLPREFLCNGCNALGSGTWYHCATCGFNLHEYCATCPASIPSPLHPLHPLYLVNLPVNDRYCDICGDLVHGLFYKCGACEFDIHPLCSQLPLHVQIPLHPQHAIKLQASSPAGCAFCAKSCMIWRYKCDVCNFNIHLDCALGDSGVFQTTATCQGRSIVPAAQPVASVGYVPYGMPTAMIQPYCGGVGYGQLYCNGLVNRPHETTTNTTKNEGQGSNGKKMRKMYSVVGKLALTAVLAAI